MTDEDLAAFLGLNAFEAQQMIPRFSPERRAAYERMAEVSVDLNLGTIPEGVIVCRPKGAR